MNVVLAFDEGPGIGLGHRRRTTGLAQALHRIGVTARLHVLTAEPVEGDLVVVDSYRIYADTHILVRADQVVAIDDIERDLQVDLVIDPDPGADARIHTRAGMVLAGAPYALLGPEVGAASSAPIREDVATVLVATGAADAAGAGARVASELAELLPDARVRLVVGPWGRSTHDPRVERVHAPDGLAPELATADVVVTAAGVTMLEACALGRPTVAFSIAENQSRALAGAAHVRAVLATDPLTAAGVAAQLAGDFDARRRLARSAASLIDGQGATRVAAVIAGMAFQGIHAR